MSHNDISNRIANARVAANMTQEQVADALQISVLEIEEIELGLRPVSTLELTRLAYAFRRPISSLIPASPSVARNNMEGDLAVALQQKLESITTRAEISFDEKDSTLLLELALNAYRLEEITKAKLREVGALIGISYETLVQFIEPTE